MKDLREDIQLDNDNDFNIWKESIRLRVKTANDTSIRARYTLIFLSLVSAGLVMSVFSYFYSWNKDFAYQYLKNKDIANIVRDGMIKEYLSTQIYQLPILGIRIMTSDIQIFGPLILLVVSTWNYYESRREHFTCGRLLADINFLLKNSPIRHKTKAIILSQEVYHNLIGYTVFNVFPYHEPLKSLSAPIIGKRSNETDAKIRSAIIYFLVSTPLISLVFIAATRILTFVIIKSSINGQIHELHKMSGLRIALLIFASILIAASGYVCCFNMIRVIRYSRATRKLLKDFRNWTLADES